MHFQRGQQLRRSGWVAGLADVRRRVCLDRRIPADGAQHVGQVGLVAICGQLGALAGLDGLVLKVFVNIFHRAELGYQRQCGLFANAGHAGDVIGRVTHQAFYVDELRRLDAVLLADGGRVHRDGLFVGRQQHGRAVVHQLQTVAVAGRQQGSAPGGLAGGGQRA